MSFTRAMNCLRVKYTLLVLALVVLVVGADSLRLSVPSVGRYSAGMKISTRQALNSQQSLRLAAAAPTSEVEGTSDVSASSFNLAKTILGSSILSLPGAVAAFSDQSSSLALACTSLAVMGAISAYSFSSIGKACNQHGVRSFKDAWNASVDPNTGGVISAMIIIKTMFACLAYSIIIGDSFSSVLQAFGSSPLLASRNNVMYLLTTSVVLPLCLLKSLDALKYTSILGLSGIVYCALFMAIRRFDGSYAPGGIFYNDIAAALRPSFGVKGTLLDEKVFILLSTAATAYVAHYNAPKIWTELKKRTPGKYDLVSYAAFGFAGIMYISVMWLGFTTFGGNASGFVLNNYSSKDVLATLGRLAIGSGILSSYPLAFTALRDGLFDLFRLNDNQKAKVRVGLTVGMLALITAIASPLKNLGVVLSLSGSLIGSALIYIVPAVMNIRNIPKRSVAEGKLTSKQQLELVLNYFIVAMGLAVSVIGVKTTLRGAGH